MYLISRKVSYGSQPMQLRLFLTKFISHKSSLPGKMSRGIESSSGSSYSAIQSQNVGVDAHVSGVAKGGYSSIRGQNFPQILVDGAEKQTEYMADLANEDKWPSLSSSINMSSKNNRRTRIDLGAQLDQKSDQGVEHAGLPQLNVSIRSNSASQADVSSLQTVLHRISPEQGVSMQNSRDPKCKPFDICFSNSRKQVVLNSSLRRKEQFEMDRSIIENGKVLRPGMVLLKSYIPLSQQIDIILRCRELGLGSGGFYQPGYEDGAKLRLHMMCLGLDWDPQTRKYGKRRQHDNSKPPEIPFDFYLLVKEALHDSHSLIKQQSETTEVEKILPSMSPDICIVNFYTSNGRLGLHQDRDESRDSLLRGLPVVSFSIGESAEFLYGDQRDTNKAASVLLESGDVLIFGGKSRHIFHGVKSIIPKTAPHALLEHAKLRPGRLNLTFRQH